MKPSGRTLVNALCVIFVLLFLSQGCSNRSWVANIYMWKAENAYTKAHELRLKKVAYESRLPYYQDACGNFLKAYNADPRIFTLNRIESAVDACSRTGDYQGEETFKEFSERYAKEHPREASYGDAFPMGDM
ncbi:MAG TPA: hypothetical protein PKL97_06530 [Candidatus Omnitrophota bacterium]|nr:hypothetical protein [Candidatus Omnitrophota bacterium]